MSRKQEHSKPYISFINKTLHFNDDIELIDILGKKIKEENGRSDKILECFDKNKHPSISRYKICDANRDILFRHLRSTMYAAYVKDMYEEVTLYLKSIILEAYENGMDKPERIVGNHKVSMSATEILKELREGGLAKKVIDEIFQSLENERSTISLISKTCDKIGITIEKKLIEQAVYYLEIRHKLVHTDGHAEKNFRETHLELKYTTSGYIDLTYQTLLNMRTAIEDLIQAIDVDALNKKILKPNCTRF